MGRLLTLLDAASGALGGGASFGPYFDTFTATNGTLITALTPDSGNFSWTAYTNSLKVLSDAVIGTSQDADNVAAFDAGVANCTVTVNIEYKSTSAYWVGIVGRLSDASNYWRVLISRQGNGFVIQEINGGVVTQRKGAVPPVYPTVGNAYELSVTFSKQIISATFNGVTIAYESATFNQTATKFGVYDYLTHAAITSVDNRINDFFVIAA